MEPAINAVITFLVLYFIYYYALRFVQSLFQTSLSCINRILSKIIYTISTPAHELAHLLVAIICFAQIENVKLFPTGDEPGYVRSSIRRSRIPFFAGVKEFFISIAPALINIPLFVFIECKYVYKCSISEFNMIFTPDAIFSKNGLITLGIFIVLISGIAPSHADLKGTIKGLIVFSIIIFGLAYYTGYIIDVSKINFGTLISLLVYYGEIIGFTLLLNIIIHFGNCFSVIGTIFKQTIKQTFSKS